jgi:cation diffusion facilitator CzcD-associated flavoprotein CzcO
MTTADTQPKIFDILIIGAGISGIGGAYHLRDQCPDKSFLVLEALESFGGTWRMHKFPGIRSDSDLYTFGYRFKPWLGKPIATREEILNYLGETIAENRLEPYFRYGHKVVSAVWSSKENLWTLTVEVKATGEVLTFASRLLWTCQGYFLHAKGYTPQWPGMDDFKGPIIHPQTWPEDVELKGKRVVCIGSGATNATIVPTIAEECEHVTLLQRSPTFFIAGRNTTDRVDQLRAEGLSDMEIHHALRKERIDGHTVMHRRSFEEPEAMRRELLQNLRAHVSDDLIEKHFTPRYRPWQQRVAFVPDGDFFQAMRDGKASVVTDEIETFTKDGVLLKSGETLEADVVVTATGFNMCVMGDVDFFVDGRKIDWSQELNYRSMMFPGIPNLIWTMGTFRGSWTLRVELICDFVCQLLQRLDRTNASRVEVRRRPQDEALPELDWIDPDDFNPGYLLRSLNVLPKRLAAPEWTTNRHYSVEAVEFRNLDLGGEEFVYSA